MGPEAVGFTSIKQTIANAAEATGTDFGFLLATAKRESSFNPRAEARTSSATGLFQFLDATWLNVLKRHGAKHGLANEAQMIQVSSNGRAYVADPKVRDYILDLRYNAEISSKMAAEFAKDNGEYIKARTGQDPQSGDLYASHFLGAAGAAELINAANRTPWISASALFPAAAASNKNIFYENGRSLSVSEVLEGLRNTTKNMETEIPNTYAQNNSEAMTDEVRSYLIAQLNNGSSNSLLSLLNGGVGNNASFGNKSSLDPMFLAHVYKQADEANIAQGMEIASQSLNHYSIAQALSPSKDNSKANE